MPNGKCQLCDQPAEVRPSGNAEVVNCLTCQEYVLIPSMLRVIHDIPPRVLAALSAYTCQAPPRVEGREPPVLRADNYEGYARLHMGTTVAEKLRRVLKYIEAQTIDKSPGTRVRVEGRTFPLFDAAEPSEVGYLLNLLVEQDYLDGPKNGHQITAKGWAHLDATVTGPEPGTCFVAMASDTVDTLYEEGIRAAVVTDCGFTVTLVEKIEHNQNIDDVIIAELRRCQFMVANFTEHRNYSGPQKLDRRLS